MVWLFGFIVQPIMEDFGDSRDSRDSCAGEVIEQTKPRPKRPKTELQPEPEPESESAAPEGAEREAKPEPANLVRLSYPGGILDPALLALLESAGGANIAHQVNAAGTSPGGLAAEVVREFPYASVHTDGPQKHLLGTVRIDTAPVELKGQKATVFSMYGQRRGGKPRKRGDVSADREAQRGPKGPS
jgi:hypothetical protein